MPDFLPQQTLQKRFPHGACGSGSRDTYAKCCNVADEKAGNEQIHEVENEMVDLGSELMRIALAGREIVEGSC